MDRTLSASRHEGDTLYHLIYNYPDSTFLTMFHMYQDVFWKIVEQLTLYWQKTERKYQGGRINICDITMQVAVELYFLSAKGGSDEHHHILLNILYGSTRVYLWRLIDVLCMLAPDVIYLLNQATRKEEAIARKH